MAEAAGSLCWTDEGGESLAPLDGLLLVVWSTEDGWACQVQEAEATPASFGGFASRREAKLCAVAFATGYRARLSVPGPDAAPHSYAAESALSAKVLRQRREITGLHAGIERQRRRAEAAEWEADRLREEVTRLRGALQEGRVSRGG